MIIFRIDLYYEENELFDYFFYSFYSSNSYSNPEKHSRIAIDSSKKGINAFYLSSCRKRTSGCKNSL
jgi:hypothetical protein